MNKNQKIAIVAVFTVAIVAGLIVMAIRQQSSLGNKDQSVLLPVRKSLEIHSPELQQIVDDLRLTDRGQDIIDDVDDVYLYYRQASVRTTCGYTESSAKGIVIEGCYSIDDAAISFVDSNNDGDWNTDEPLEIDGDSMIVFDYDNIADTMAHEFLHAVYIRLSDEERNELNKLIYSTYEDNKAELDKILRPYDFGSFDQYTFPAMNELHSFIGVKIAELPYNLENHYSLYFEDRSIVVALAAGQELPAHSHQGYTPEIERLKPDAPPPEPEPEPTPPPATPRPAPVSTSPPAPPATPRPAPQQYADIIKLGQDILDDLTFINRTYAPITHSCEGIEAIEAVSQESSDSWTGFLAIAPDYGASTELDAIEARIRAEIITYDKHTENYNINCIRRPYTEAIVNRIAEVFASQERQEVYILSCNYAANLTELESIGSLIEDIANFDLDRIVEGDKERVVEAVDNLAQNQDRLLNLLHSTDCS